MTLSFWARGPSGSLSDGRVEMGVHTDFRSAVTAIASPAMTTYVSIHGAGDVASSRIWVAAELRNR